MITRGKREILRLAAEECALAYRRGVVAGIGVGLLSGMMVGFILAVLVAPR